MNRGYVRLWRKSKDTGWLKNHKLWAFWSYCLMSAAYKEHDALIGFQTVHLHPGQFIFGRKKAAIELGMSEREVRTCLQSLSNSKNLTIKTTNKFSIITIINWVIYQGEKSENDHQNDQQTTNKRPASDQQVTTYKKEKKGKKEKKEKTFSSDSDEIRLSELLFSEIQKRNPNHKIPNLQSWAKNIDLMIRVDKREPWAIQKIVLWAQKDVFWQNNILSTAKLREKFDQLVLKMKEENGSGNSRWFQGKEASW